MKHYRLRAWAKCDVLMALMSVLVLITGIEMYADGMSGWWIVIGSYVLFNLALISDGDADNEIEPYVSFDQHDKAKTFANILILTVWTIIFNWLPFGGLWSFIVAFAGACTSSHYLVPLMMYGFDPQINDGTEPPATNISIKKIWRWRSK